MLVSTEEEVDKTTEDYKETKIIVDRFVQKLPAEMEIEEFLKKVKNKELLGILAKEMELYDLEQLQKGEL
jgi:hypothetical protein